MKIDAFDFFPGWEKINNTEKFIKRGWGNRSCHGRRCHAHSGSGCDSKSSLGFDKDSKKEHKDYIERQAARFDADTNALID